ncbi:tetratricopeptide repeat protein [Streptomyces sp. HPF1205]|uniref:ATP-binding protein n=1 Tax=Streptomyces sp. HPF1205 TaxID=2873262 RepID=UPI001CEE0294|nr:tetratricopeptide repeat protein [Streptomyces sp. HPF1205]
MIVGTAGVGKTSLAVRWAHQVRDLFPDGQLYVNLHGYDPGPPVAATDVLVRFLRALDIPVERIPTGEEPRAELFRSSMAERRILIVLDNAATAGQIRPLLPGAPNCLVVITSRTRMSGLVAREGAYRVSLETLSQSASVQLLRTVLAAYRTSDNDEELAELARLCARLPLALRIVAERAAARPRMPLRDLIADLRDESGLWDALSAEDEQNPEQTDAVRTVFAWSYRSLTPQAARMFRLLGLHPGPDFSLEAAAALSAVPPVTARRQLDTLAGAHLLEESGHHRYEFHDLLRAYALDQAQSEETEEGRQAASERVLGWYLHSAAAAAQAGANTYTLPVALHPLPENVTAANFQDDKAAIAWYETERANLIAAVQVASAGGMDRIAWQIPAVLTMIIADREPADTWLPTQQMALEAARRAEDRYGEAITLDNLGIAYRHLFQLPQAEEHFSRTLTVFRALGDTLGQARAANGLGVTHMLAHDIDQAAVRFEEALRLVRELGNPLYTGAFTRNLGWALLERGDLHRAETALRQAADVLSAAGESLEQAETLTLLAAVYRRSHRFDEADGAAEQALAIAGDSDATLFEALALLELGRNAIAREEATEALGHLQQAAALFQRAGRPDLQAAAWDATGEAYCLLQRTEDAAGFHRQAATAHRSRGDQWSLAAALAHLAATLVQDRNFLEAQEHCREALQLLANFSGPEAEAKRSHLEALLHSG